MLGKVLALFKSFKFLKFFFILLETFYQNCSLLVVSFNFKLVQFNPYI